MHVLRPSSGSRGLLPACVESRVGGAYYLLLVKDPHSRISTMLHQHRDAIKVLKPKKRHVAPYVFYLGLT